MQLLQQHEKDSVQSVEAHAMRVVSDGLTETATKALEGVKEARSQTHEVLKNSNAERDMLETQLLANGESLHLIKKLVETVNKMKAEVASLENHEQKCKKKLADLKGQQAQRAADTLAANTVQ